MQDFTTPMMKQYLKIKQDYQDCLLFYRMGDFYELFLDDAKTGAEVLDITLTSRPKGRDGRIPMAGVPYHAVDTYLSKLVKVGYKVAICEQVSPPNKRGIIEREVIRIVTPGTIMDEKALEKKENNYLISLLIEGETLALTAADISTGYMQTMEYTSDNLPHILFDELSRLGPSECILPEQLYNNPELLKQLTSQKQMNIYCFHEWDSFASNAERVLKNHFRVKTLAGLGLAEKNTALKTTAALLGYVEHTQKQMVKHLKKIRVVSSDSAMLLDKSTIVNLELFSTIREHDTRGSLISVLDQTVTAMGGRLLKEWLKKPLKEKKDIEIRFDAVSTLLKEREVRESLRNELKQISDIERLLARLSVGIGNARDLISLKQSLNVILDIKNTLKPTDSSLLQDIYKGITPDLSRVIDTIDAYIVPEPPVDVKSGKLINVGISKELDGLRDVISKSKSWLVNLEQQERKRTGISSLKVRFNKVFGFYIEVSKSNLQNIPENYIRKQTLVNGERFITPELKEKEEIILTAEEKVNELEYQLFLTVLERTLTFIDALQHAAERVAILDCILNFAHLSEKENYVRPTLLYSGEIRITGGRHPVVEKLIDSASFVPNDVELNATDQQLLLITGPNMAGKSVFIRQVALLCLMAQIGCFVPAQKAHLSILDRIFVRSGASDVITSGLSTFMVEMVETAHILHYATKNSLIVMDEIGRGTSTYDGISIAWAVAEYLVTHEKVPPKTLFATHYHELQALEHEYPKKIKNYHMAVVEENDEPIFLHTIQSGGASHSFGVAVAKLAGVPNEVIERAYEILRSLEQRGFESEKTPAIQSETKDPNQSPVISRSETMRNPNQEPTEISHFARNDNLIDKLLHKELEKLDVANMTPLEALNKLADLKEKIKLLEKEKRQIYTAD